MRRIALLCCALCLLGLASCRAASDWLLRGFCRGLAEEYDSSRPNPEERGVAFDRYIQEHASSAGQSQSETPQKPAALPAGDWADTLDN